jgi:protein gp37
MKLSPACDGCYAENLMDTRHGRVEWGAPGKGAGTRSRTSTGYWHQPFTWNKKAKAAGKRPFVFCASLADVFDNQVPPAWRRELFYVISATPNLVWLLLTKRPGVIADLSKEAGGLPPNAAIGTTAEDQTRWDKNIGELAAAKAVTEPLFAFVSSEPLLGPINPRHAKVTPSMRRHFAWQAGHDFFDPLHPRQDRRFKLDWVITGGETDQGAHKARPSHPDWFRTFRNACESTGTPYHHKQNGEFSDFDHIGMSWNNLPDAIRVQQQFVNGKAMIKVGKTRSGRLLDGVLHDARPAVAAA